MSAPENDPPEEPPPLLAAHTSAMNLLMGGTIAARRAGLTPTKPALHSLRRRRTRPAVSLDEAVECHEDDGSAPGLGGVGATEGSDFADLPTGAIRSLDDGFGSSIFDLVIED